MTEVLHHMPDAERFLTEAALCVQPGGISMRSLMRGWSFSSWRSFEASLDRWMSTLGTFAKIV
jgi:2-polyprenyl-3-methyl-5-hydroxy-6-metoxy-1,4-benzoquinol methylase